MSIPYENDIDDRSITEKIIQGFKKHWKLYTALIIVLILVITVWTISSKNKAAENQRRVLEEARMEESTAPEATVAEGVDAILMGQQQSLRRRYGTPTPGFIWDVDGTPLSLGDPSLDPDQVIYTYLRALSTLDFTVAESLSRRSSVIKTYNKYFDRNLANTIGYKDQYNREVYRQSLLSLQVEGIQRSANFSTNRMVYTINARMLDLSDKSAWRADQEYLYENLDQYTESEEDKVKAETFLFDYIKEKYRESVVGLTTGRPVENSVPLRDVTFDLTVEKFPAQETGWLVSIDKDLDLLSKNQDGTSLASFIKSEYQAFVLQRQKAELRGETITSNSTPGHQSPPGEGFQPPPPPERTGVEPLEGWPPPAPDQEEPSPSPAEDPKPLSGGNKV